MLVSFTELELCSPRVWKTKADLCMRKNFINANLILYHQKDNENNIREYSNWTHKTFLNSFVTRVSTSCWKSRSSSRRCGRRACREMSVWNRGATWNDRVICDRGGGGTASCQVPDLTSRASLYCIMMTLAVAPLALTIEISCSTD